jgi:hypothetical protein
MASTRSKQDETVESVSAVDDPRFHINRRPSLPSIRVIAVLDVLAGTAGPTEPIRKPPRPTGHCPVMAIAALRDALSHAGPRIDGIGEES